MKDENNGKVMIHFIGLGAKMYDYQVKGDKKDKKRAKGVKGSSLREITFEDYKRCLFEEKEYIVTQNLIKRKKNNFFTIKKIGLNYRDNKRIRSPYITDTLPWGYNYEAKMDVDE